MHIRRISVAKYPYPFKQGNYYPYPIRIRENCEYPQNIYPRIHIRASLPSTIMVSYHFWLSCWGTLDMLIEWIICCVLESFAVTFLAVCAIYGAARFLWFLKEMKLTIPEVSSTDFVIHILNLNNKMYFTAVCSYGSCR